MNIKLIIEVPISKVKVEHEVSCLPHVSLIEMVKQVYRVEQKFVCCGETDLYAIGNLSTDTTKGRWWTMTINGDFNKTNSNSILHEGDMVELFYEQTGLDVINITKEELLGYKLS